MKIIVINAIESSKIWTDLLKKQVGNNKRRHTNAIFNFAAKLLAWKRIFLSSLLIF